jgi:P-type Cu+ transporter
MLRLAASVEVWSEHPLASAIVGEAQEKGLRFDRVSDFGSVTGQGISGIVSGRQFSIGNEWLMGRDIVFVYRPAGRG